MLNRIIVFFIFIFVFTGSFAGGQADTLQAHVKYGIDNKVIKSIDTSLLQQLRKERDFIYFEEKPHESGFLKWLFGKAGRFIESLLKKKATPYVFYVLVGLIFVFLLYKLFDKRVNSIFTPSGRVINNTPDFGETDLALPNYDSRFLEAIRYGDYSTAVRFLFLKHLQQLNNRQLITWKPGKTNIEYCNEIKQPSVRTDFIALSGMYEYVWYGQFAVSVAQFDLIQQRFEQAFKQIHD